MRLINSKTYRLEEFYSEIPPYAILSHTWADDEVTFQDWQGDFAKASKKKGFAKIQCSCEQAYRDGYDYLWCDTNCIDKTSSAELTEAINSMFAWYQSAAVCYAFLSDVPHIPKGDDPDRLRQLFCKSRWFTRGWTLQELLAPTALIFYDNTWARLGDRKSLSSRISQTTGIRKRFLAPYVDEALREPESPSNASIAERMSWLSRRETTRVEDLAYCMLGIFDINMALLYGEGQKAFVRLQEEIIKASNDQTIFCWRWDDEHVPDDWVSMLSPSPRTFEGAGKYKEPPLQTLSYTMTNTGLSISLPIVEHDGTTTLCLALLDVREKRLRVAIPLLGPEGKDLYQRSPFPQGPIPMLASTRTKDRDIKVFARRGKMPNPRMLLSNLDVGDYGILFRHRDEVIRPSTEWKFLPRPLSLDLLRLEPLDDRGHFGSVLPLWVRIPTGDEENSDLQFQLASESEDLLIIFFGVQVREAEVSWRCKVVDIITWAPRYKGDGLNSKDLGPYLESCKQSLREMKTWLQAETPGNSDSQTSHWKTFYHLGINVSTFLGPSVKANDRTKISVAQVHFSIIPKTSQRESAQNFTS